MDAVTFIGSLIAILALAGLAAWLRLGTSPRLTNEEQARQAANEAVEGFEPVRFGLDREGAGALLEDARGRLLLLKPHGNFFAGRVLTAAATVQQGADTLSIDCGESTYGEVTLALDDAPYWVEAIHRLKRSLDA